MTKKRVQVDPAPNGEPDAVESIDLTPAPDPVPDPVVPDESRAPELEAPASILDIFPPAPAGAPNPEAAAQLAESLGAPPAEPDPQQPNAAPAFPGSPAAPGAPAPGHWSRAKIRAAKKGELGKRVQELQAQLATRPAGSAAPGSAGPAAAPAAPPPNVSEKEVRAQLDGLLLAIDAGAVHFGHPALALSQAERDTLAGSFVPAAMPHYAFLKDKFPWAIGVLCAVGIYVPKGLDAAEQIKAERERQAKLDGAEAIEGATVTVYEEETLDGATKRDVLPFNGLR